ncbi:MAG: hypothetical protein IJH64_05885, partial [Oscillospiraceae bacterium]|nr:hypothetical protein [Oscillospiraceae bacterium]
VIGYRFSVLPWSDKALGPQIVTVLGTELPEGVKVGEPSQDTFLRFSGWNCAEYYSDFSKRREVSIKAESVQVDAAEKTARVVPTI